jgi:predicted cation transporter
MLPYTIDDIWFWFLFLILVLAFLIKKVTRNCESVFTYILESASLKMH